MVIILDMLHIVESGGLNVIVQLHLWKFNPIFKLLESRQSQHQNKLYCHNM